MKKNYLVFVLVFLMIAVTGLSFAYWDSLSNSDSQTVDIGVGAEVTVSGSIETGNLVPEGVLMGNGDVTSLTSTYTVVINKAPAAPYNLEVEITTVTNESAEDVKNLFVFEINGEIDGSATYTDAFTDTKTEQQVVIEVSLVADGETVDFSKIIGQTITFGISFVTVKK